MSGEACLRKKGELLAKHHLRQRAFAVQCPLASRLTPWLQSVMLPRHRCSFEIEYHASARRVSNAERWKIPQQPKTPAITVRAVISTGTERIAPIETAAAVLKK